MRARVCLCNICNLIKVLTVRYFQADTMSRWSFILLLGVCIPLGHSLKPANTDKVGEGIAHLLKNLGYHGDHPIHYYQPEQIHLAFGGTKLIK